MEDVDRAYFEEIAPGLISCKRCGMVVHDSKKWVTHHLDYHAKVDATHEALGALTDHVTKELGAVREEIAALRGRVKRNE